MKRNKRNTSKRKLALLSLATAFPLATTGIVATTIAPLTALAASSTTTYQKSYVQEVSLYNNNFNSSSSTSLNSSPSGWSKQLSDNKTTAGVINVGSSFQRYMSSTYRLGSNPGKSASDSHILMINSKTQNSGDDAIARQGFRSNSINLAANSYYSFKVAFKTNTNFQSITEYEKAGQIETDGTEISDNYFKAKPFKVDADGNPEDEHISFSYKNTTYYLLKKLDKLEDTSIDADLENVEIFYEDDNFVGFLKEENGAEEEKTSKPVYVSKKNITDPTDKKEGKVNIKAGATLYECKDIVFTPATGSKTSGTYKVKGGIDYFNSKTTQKPLNADVRGAIYLDGLKDNDGKTVKAEFVGITSKQWVNFNFFVATGNQSQTVNLELWLGSKNTTSSGAVFFDNVRINQHSENNFWKTYQESFDLGYDITFDEGAGQHQNCTKFFDFRTSKELSSKELSVSDTEETSFNFDFEQGVYHDDATTLKNWKKDENSAGNARVFDASSGQEFKVVTGYDFVGTDLSYDVVLEETEEEFPRLKVKTSAENKYVLGLWTNKNYAKVTSKPVKIESQKAYKITAKYKVSSISEGNVYVSIKENDSLVKALVDKDAYTLATETSSSAKSSNQTNNFTNDFGSIEFYVRGGTLYDSAIDISLGLGKSDEVSTGCVVFDNIKIEKATIEEYESASNKLQLGSSNSSSTIKNGDFDLVNTDGEEKGMFAPQNWTITKGEGFVFSGIINTDKTKYEKARQAFETYKKQTNCLDNENPYYWATYTNPGNVFGDDIPENVLALGNVSNSWQKLKSETMDISANTAYNSSTDPTYKLSFKYKTYTTNKGFKVTLFLENGTKLYESSELSSSSWQEYAIYLKSFPGASKIYLEIDFGSQSSGTTGIVYLDQFNLDESATIVEGEKNLVDMSDFGLKLPSGSIGSALDKSSTPAFTGTTTSNEGGNSISGGIVKGSAFEKGKSRYYVEDAQDENFFFISVGGAGAYNLQSNFNIDLEASSYYVLSFKAKTFFNYLNDGVTLDEKKAYEYGLTFGLTGFKYITKVVSNEKFEEYKLFINSTDAKSTQLYMALICDTPETAGSVAIYDLDLTKTTEDEFKEAQSTTEAKDFDVNTSKVFASATEDTTPDPDENPEENENTNSNDAGFNWLLIPTLITALAIVIAVVGYFLRKVKIKKIEIKRKNSYDRKTSSNVDFIKRKAVEERDKELSVIQASKAKFEEDLEKLETIHKSKVVALREKDKGEMSKETDKEFKTFAKKRTVIAEKIEVLNKQIEETNSPEHLLSLERKIFAEQEAQKRKLEKSSKKAQKENSEKEKVEEKKPKTKKK